MYLPLNLFNNITNASLWISNKIEDINESYWLEVFLYGPAIYGRILSKKVLWYKIYLTTTLIWPLILPIFIYPTDGKFSMLTLFGFFVKFDFVYDVFAQLVATVYLLSILKFIFDMATLIEIKINFSFIVDIVCQILMLLPGYWFLWRYGADIAYPLYWLFSFTFILFPLFTLIITILDIKILYFNNNNNNNEESKSDKEIQNQVEQP